jgi:flagellar basal-body rod protein FlgF
MDSGFYSACAGFAAQSQALELVAHNLANLGTAGYRGESATFRSMVTGSAPSNALNAALNNYGVLGGGHTDLSPGSLTATGNPLDLGLAGQGFFVVRSAAGTVYTRDGGFHITSAGQLVTANGEAVLGQQGSINLPSGPVAVTSDGTVSVSGNVIAQLRLAEFSPDTNLQPLGNALYAAPANAALPAASTTVRQGMIEASNISTVGSMMQLITTQRNADMLARALTIFDTQFNQTAVQDLPRV